MNARCRLSPIACAAAAAVWLSACGGGGGAPAAPAAPDVPAALTLGGVAATGAPMAGASVTVRDAAGRQVCATTTAGDGRYGCTLATGAAAPFAVTATLDDQKLYSVATDGGTANVTPLTTLIAARLVPDGDPARLAEAIHADPAIASAPKVQQKVDEVQTLLAPLLQATGDRTDPLRGSFAADGSGHDEVLDALQVSIRPAGDASNIEITVKTRPSSDAADPVKLSFRSDDAAPAPLAQEVRADDLPDVGIAGQLEGLMGRATACYAVPLAQRIEGVSPGTAVANGDAAAVTSPACKALFVDRDPTQYLDNGLRVGTNGAFPGLFRDSATGTRFDRPVLEYQLANGDGYVTFRTTAASGAVGWSALTVRKADGVLRAVGNQYVYAAGVQPYAARREFPLQPQYSWIGSGYSPSIANRLDPSTRLPVFREAYVTAPDGRRATYRPLAGRPQLGIVGAGGRQRVNVVQFLGAAFVDPATAGTPAQKDGAGGAYFVDPQLGDDALRALPEQGVWTIEFVHVDESVPNVVQRYRTVSRAPTVAEVRQMRFARVSEGFLAELLARSDVAAYAGLVFGTPSAQAPNRFRFGTADGGDGWVVPEGALAPSSINVYGATAVNASFANSESVVHSARQGGVNCASQSANDLHCDDATGVLQFAAGARITAFDLWVRNGRQLQVQTQVNLYRLAD